MKTLTLKFIVMLGLLIGQSAMAAPSVSVNSLRVKGLGNFVGQNLTVYYAVGKKASIATEPSQIQISEVKVKTTVAISAGDVILPQVQVPLMNVSSYNMIVFVVHPRGPFRWVNVNGEVPVNESSSGSNVYTAIQSASKNDIDNAKAQSGIQSGNVILDVQLF